MDEKVYFLASELNDELRKDPRVIQLEELDKQLNDSFEVYNLSKQKDIALEEYVSNKDLYGEKHEITLNSLKKLQDAKVKLNTHPLVERYLKVYSEVRDLYLQINNILLDDFKGGKC